jgi:hypothetical protein
MMTTFLRTLEQPHDWRIARFRIVAALIVVGVWCGDGIGILAPWIDPESNQIAAFQNTIQGWYAVERSVYAGILITGSLLALLWQPRGQALLLQFLLLAGAVLAIFSAPFDRLTSSLQIIAIALLALAHPSHAALAKLFQPSPFSWPLLALSLLVAAVLALDIGHAPQALVAPQMHDQHTLTAGMLAITLALAGLLAATKRPGWHILGLLTGAALIYLGLVAARLPGLPGSWGFPVRRWLHSADGRLWA